MFIFRKPNFTMIQLKRRDMPLACFNRADMVRIRNMPKAKALKKSSFLKTKTKNAYDL